MLSSSIQVIFNNATPSSSPLILLLPIITGLATTMESTTDQGEANTRSLWHRT